MSCRPPENGAGCGGRWRLTLREGLKFHDGTPVLARDVVASIKRGAASEAFGLALMEGTEEFAASDDKVLRFRLKRPFPLLPDALGKPGSNMPCIMPERLAATDPFKPMTENERQRSIPVPSPRARFGLLPAAYRGGLAGVREGFAQFYDVRPRLSGGLRRREQSPCESLGGLPPMTLASAMALRILRLYPGPTQETALAGAYLAHDLRALASAAAPFVYADFVASLDGRIALHDPNTQASHVPQVLRSPRDFRLLLELQAQADCVVTHGGYLRAIAAGRLDDILQVGLRDDTRDLARWRERHGLAPQPAIAIASASLEFPIPSSLARHGQRVIVATGAAASADRQEALRARGFEIIVAGSARWVEGAPLTRTLAALGYRTIFLLAGPRMLETMLRDGVLKRLYLTIVHRLLGGESFHTLISGPELGAAGRLELAELYYGAADGSHDGEWFAQFDLLRREKEG